MMQFTRTRYLIAPLIVGLALAACTPAPDTSDLSEDGPAFRLLWERQVDPRWQPGDGQENGITVEFVEFSPDGTLLLTGNGQGEVFVLDAADGAVVQTLTFMTEEELAAFSQFDISGGRAKAHEVESGTFLDDGRLVAVGGNLTGIKIFRLDDGQLVESLAVDGEVDGMAASPDGRYFAHAGQRAADVVDPSDWTRLYHVPHGDAGAVNSIDFTSDEALMASADGAFGHIILTRLEDGAQAFDLGRDSTAGVKSVRFSPDDRYVAAGYEQGRMVVFRVDDGSVAASLPLNHYIEAVAWTADGRYLMAGGRDGRGMMTVYRAGDWDKVAEVEVQHDAANIEYFDTHADLLAVAGEDARVKLYRIVE